MGQSDDVVPPIGGTGWRHNGRHALIGLDEETIRQVVDVLEDCSYVRLKESLLNELTLDKRTPRQLLKKMSQLGWAKVCSELLKSLWLQRLPRTVGKVHEVYGRP